MSYKKAVFYRINRKNEGTWYKYVVSDEDRIVRCVGTLGEIKDFFKNIISKKRNLKRVYIS